MLVNPGLAHAEGSVPPYVPLFTMTDPAVGASLPEAEAPAEVTATGPMTVAKRIATEILKRLNTISSFCFGNSQSLRLLKNLSTKPP